jgi:hypothetical protein
MRSLKDEGVVKKRKAAELNKRPWKILYLILCLCLLAFTAYQFLNFLPAQTTGWDYQAYVSGVLAFEHGINPYIPSNLILFLPQDLSSAGMTFDYPPHTLYFFGLLDTFLVFHSMTLYYVLLLLLVVVSAYLMVNLDNKPHYLFLITLLLTGFMSLTWNFLTGNSPLIFLLLFAVTFTFLVKKKYWESSVVMGLSSAFSLFTAPFVALFLLVERPIKERIAIVCLSLGVVALLFVFDYVVNPLFLKSYLNLMMSSTGPFTYSGGWNEPTVYMMFKEFLKGISPENIVPLIIVSSLYLALVAFATGKYYQKNKENNLKILSLAMLSIFMILPRITPYDFIILVVPLYLLFKDCSYRVKSLVLLVITIPPLFVWEIAAFGVQLPSIFDYAQAFSLILVFITAILFDQASTESDSAGKEGKKSGRTRKNSKKSAEE